MCNPHHVIEHARRSELFCAGNTQERSEDDDRSSHDQSLLLEPGQGVLQLRPGAARVCSGGRLGQALPDIISGCHRLASPRLLPGIRYKRSSFVPTRHRRRLWSFGAEDRHDICQGRYAVHWPLGSHNLAAAVGNHPESGACSHAQKRSQGASTLPSLPQARQLSASFTSWRWPREGPTTVHQGTVHTTLRMAWGALSLTSTTTMSRWSTGPDVCLSMRMRAAQCSTSGGAAALAD